MFGRKKWNFLKKQKELFFICPKCAHYVKVNTLPDGRTLIQALLDAQLNEVDTFEVSHADCGFKFTMATAVSLSVKMSNKKESQ